MTGEFLITDHALRRFRERFSDPEATGYDLGVILAGMKPTRYEKRGDDDYIEAVLEDACFLLKKKGPGKYVVVTVLHAHVRNLRAS